MGKKDLALEAPDAVLVALDREGFCAFADHRLGFRELALEVRAMGCEAAGNHLRPDLLLNLYGHCCSFDFVDLGDQVAFDVGVDALVDVFAHFCISLMLNLFAIFVWCIHCHAISTLASL